MAANFNTFKKVRNLKLMGPIETIENKMLAPGIPIAIPEAKEAKVKETLVAFEQAVAQLNILRCLRGRLRLLKEFGGRANTRASQGSIATSSAARQPSRPLTGFSQDRNVCTFLGVSFFRALVAG
jgi:hypothetical protein